jgi:pimeloyl-ACP methyl ester carboxylesterase
MKLLLGLTAALTLSAAGIDGAKIHWATSGTGDKVVVFVHGWTCDSTTWAGQVPAIARKYRVITIDLPGHGQSESPKSGNFSMNLFAKSIEAVRREAKADHLILVGHSMGTPVVVQYARMYPQHTAALVLVDGTVMKADDAAALAGVSHRFEGPDASKARAEFVQGMFTPATTADLRPKILKMMTAPPNATAAGAMAAMGDPAIWTDDPITIPMLGIYADKSRLANHELMSRRFPSLEYVEIPGTDHFLMLEKPQEFNRLLMAFLDKLQ